MGCGNSSATQEDDERKRLLSTVSNVPYHEGMVSDNINFKDFEEIPSGPYLGIGVKKILNYRCPLTYDELENLRIKFWSSRDKTDVVWSVLQMCCEVGGDEAEKILQIHNQKVVEKDMKRTYNLFHPNYIYQIPNYCIADPVFVKDFNAYEKIYDTTDDNILNLNLFYFNDNKTYPLRITNKCTGFDLKRKFAKMMKINLQMNKLRVVCRGQELTDTHCLYFHDLDENSRIVVMCSQIQNKYVVTNQ